jgi:hypothetical protein
MTRRAIWEFVSATDEFRLTYELIDEAYEDLASWGGEGEEIDCP